MLTIDTIPLCPFWILDFGSWICRLVQTLSPISNSQIELFVFFVQRMAAATATELLELEPVRRVLFVLGRHVIPLFALGALQNYVISRHINSALGGRWPVVSRSFLITDH
jgi:hypothetical protein